MHPRFYVLLLATLSVVATPLLAQMPCPSFSIAVGTEEDKVMLAINGAENPQEQIAALDKFEQSNPDSKFIPCANEYYASISLKQNNFDKAIEYGEKDLALNYQDLNLFLTLMRAYVGSTKVSDTAFDVINKVPDQVKAEVVPQRPKEANDADWDKIQKESAELAKDSRAYAVYAFFQLLPRVTDLPKRIQIMDNFVKAYPEAEKDYAAQLNNAYFDAYRMQNQIDKAGEYGEKAVAADPNNVVIFNWLGESADNAKFFADRGQKQVLCGYYDARTEDGMKKNISRWLQFSSGQPGILGFMYTTWGHDYARLKPYFKLLDTADTWYKPTGAAQQKAEGMPQ